MKVEIEDIKDNGFKPFRVVLDIESIQELRELYCRFLLSINDLKYTINKEGYHKIRDALSFSYGNDTDKIHDVLLNKLKEYEQ